MWWSTLLILALERQKQVDDLCGWDQSGLHRVPGQPRLHRKRPYLKNTKQQRYFLFWSFPTPALSVFLLDLIWWSLSDPRHAEFVVIYFMCTHVLIVMCHMMQSCEGTGSPGLELQTVAGHLAGDRNWIQVLCKSRPVLLTAKPLPSSSAKYWGQRHALSFPSSTLSC